MKFYKYMVCLLFAGLAVSCSDDDDKTLQIVPEKTGTFVDERDGFTYHWVRIGGLDWAVENAHYYTDDLTCIIQQGDLHGGDVYYTGISEKYLPRYGYLYTYEGAQLAVPKGWRIPSDEDWKSLERALGMSATEVDCLDWRGDRAGELMQQEGEGTGLAMVLGGLAEVDSYSYLGCYGFFWTSTVDESKEGDYVFYRKLVYNMPEVYRQSMKKEGFYISLRFVRDAK
jgi:uncharacterized protein (TIGR02145 family)